MATIFQKIFLPKYQWIILDFIDKNQKKIEYSFAENDYSAFHTFFVSDAQFSLSTTLNKRKSDSKLWGTRNFTKFTFSCNTSGGCSHTDCVFKNGGFTGESDSWMYKEHRELAYKIYNRMLKHYMKNANSKEIKCK